MIPDMMMDLSLSRFDKPLFRYIKDELKIPAGVVLSYIPFSKKNGLDWGECQTYFKYLSDQDIDFVTVHFTANIELFELAREGRHIPVTSRGGAICIYDQKINNRPSNLFLEHIDEIADWALSNSVAISLGSTFRPGNIFDAQDVSHIYETRNQLEICKYLQRRGVNVIVENIGHISIQKLEEHSHILKEFDAPIMPLGPIPTDFAPDQDHICNAVGAAFASYWGCADIINSITRCEHSRPSFSKFDIYEGVVTAKTVAHIIDVARGIELDKDLLAVNQRRATKSCMVDGSNCNRCHDVCPLKLI